MTTRSSENGARLWSNQSQTTVAKNRKRPQLRTVAGNAVPRARKRSPVHGPVDARVPTTPKRNVRPTPRARPKAKPHTQTHRDKRAKTQPAVRPARSSKAPRTGFYQRFGASLGFSTAAAILWMGWKYRDANIINAEEGLGYALGIVATCCMLTLLVYPIRKRLKFLRFIGSVRNWFRTHMILGVLTTLTALYHCNFNVGSLNSQIALYSLLLVAGSGIIGRFLYRKIHQNLYGKKANRKQLRAQMRATQPTGSKIIQFLPLVTQRINAFDERVLDAGNGTWTSLVSLPGLARRTKREYKVLIGFSKRQLAKEARNNPVIATHQQRLLGALRAYVVDHMLQLRRIAKLQVYERLFALWHVVHLPFFGLLVVTVTLHVLAVHLY